MTKRERAKQDLSEIRSWLQEWAGDEGVKKLRETPYETADAVRDAEFYADCVKQLDNAISVLGVEVMH